MSCCCYAVSWHNLILKSLKKVTVSLRLPHPVLEQVIFEPGEIRTWDRTYIPCQDSVPSGPCWWLISCHCAPHLFHSSPLGLKFLQLAKAIASSGASYKVLPWPGELSPLPQFLMTVSWCRFFPDSKPRTSKEPLSTYLHSIVSWFITLVTAGDYLSYGWSLELDGMLNRATDASSPLFISEYPASSTVSDL